jgi:protein-tyrosine phosphatase
MDIFHKKNKGQGGLARLYCDMHSHLIPGVDDGAPDMDTVLQLIRGLVDLGYRKIITTPHIMWDLYKNTHETIRTKEKMVKAALEQEGIDVEFHAAAEYFMDDHFEELLDTDEPLLTLKENVVLVEFSLVSLPLDLRDKIFKLQIKGYQPVIGHPERYLYFGADKNWYADLKATGCWFQLNLLSINGYYGRGPADLAQFLLRRKYIDLLGTDLHHSGHLEALRASSSIMNTANRLLDAGILQNPVF